MNRDGGTAELETIVDCSFWPCIDQSVFGPTRVVIYWSSTTFTSFRFAVWLVSFAGGDLTTFHKFDGGFHVRAVRGAP